jgi:hypothetical protein
MKIKTASEHYLERAKRLSEEETERVLSRMGGKLRKRSEKEKVALLEAVAIQLELEDEMLKEWRERFAEIKARHDKLEREKTEAGKASNNADGVKLAEEKRAPRKKAGSEKK